ncbi:MAG: hypothetical protein IPK22_15670 [Verrucomicrobiaceae bacterium]|nr:hypothetical protein [Verrucomicrobiaceae bacterium]
MLSTKTKKAQGRLGYSDLTIPIAEVKPTIFAHPEFTAFTTKAKKLFTKWQTASVPLLKGLAKGGHPKPLIETIAEDLLATFKTAPLLDAYDVYQHLMDYWAETMQDDCYLIADAGWIAGARPREIVQVKNKENKLVWPEKEDFKKGKRRFKSDLIPAALLIARYFAAERDAIAALEAELASIEQQLDEMREEHSGEDGLLAEVIEGEGEKQKITAKALKARLKDIGKNKDDAEERQALEAYAIRHAARPAGRHQDPAQDRAGRPGGQARGPIPHAYRDRHPDPRRGRQMARHPRRRRAGRAGPRLANPHRPHPPARRTLRHPAAATHR